MSEEERRYQNGQRARLLDIVRIPLEHQLPQHHQVENHLLAEDYYWEKQGAATWQQVRALADTYDANFWVNGQSTYNGINDKLPEAIAHTRTSSLKLLLLPQLHLEVRMEEAYDGRPDRKRLRGRFAYQGHQYLLSVTDPEIEETYLAYTPDTYAVNDVAVCVSLAEVWNGFAFRLIASVITSERCGAQNG